MKNSLSVIIATYNRSQSLAKTLESFLLQNIDDTFDYELIVVDNNSKDGTKEAVASFESRFKGKLRYLFEPISGKSHALNKGIKEAGGDILVFTDDDVQLDFCWLESLFDCFKKQSCDGVGGRVLPVYPNGTPRWVRESPHQAAGAVVIYDYGEESREFSRSTMDLFIGANYAFKRKVFDECGSFRTDLSFGRIALGEDIEFINRLLKKNKVLYYCGKALVWHPVDLRRLNLGHVARWNVALGRFAAREEKEEGRVSAFWFGIPKYLFRGVLIDGILLLPNIFSKKNFYHFWRSLFRKLGMISEYRRLQNDRVS